MLTRYAAQALVDGFSALALGASAAVLVRQGPSAPLRAQLGFVLGGLCLFFATRSAFEALDWAPLGIAVLLIVCVLPLAALVLAEGVLRRHAPAALKVLVTAGALVMAATIIATGGREPVSSAGLGGYVIISLLCVTVLLLMRERISLSPQENASVGALIAAAALLTLLTLSDFLPMAPLGFSGLGAAILAFALGANPSSAREARRLLADLLAMGLLATVAAVAFMGPLALRTPWEPVRLGASVLAVLLAGGAVAGALRRWDGRSSQDFTLALARADATDLDTLMEGLAGQPLLAGLRVAEGVLLADYDVQALGAGMAARAVWTRRALETEDPQVAACVREELGDLMARTEATHALMVSRSPLRIALLTLPNLGPAEEAEAHLALFRKLAAIAAKDPA